MNRLILNGNVFHEPLPEDWTLWQLVDVLEARVIPPTEIVVGLWADGKEAPVSPDHPGVILGDVETVEVQVRAACEVVTEALVEARVALRGARTALERAVDAYRVGDEPGGHSAYREGLAALTSFVDLSGRLAPAGMSGVAPGVPAGSILRALHLELSPLVREVEKAATAEDVVELCDALDAMDPWFSKAGSALDADESEEADA